jgi:hypothetical protein
MVGSIELKVQLNAALKADIYEVAKIGAHKLVTGSAYADIMVPLSRTLTSGKFLGLGHLR